MGVTNHHRTGKVLVEVIDIFTHPTNKIGKKIKNSAVCDSFSKRKTVSYRLVRLPDTQM